MSIENDAIEYDGYGGRINNYTMLCDNCGCMLKSNFGFELFEDMIEVAKQSGWRFTKGERGEWYDYCPLCAKELNIRVGPSAAQDFEGVQRL